MMNRLSMETVTAINSARYFMSNEKYEAPQMRPWQYVMMEYDRMNLVPPANIPPLRTMEDAQIWMCLDARYNQRLRMREDMRSYHRTA